MAAAGLPYRRFLQWAKERGAYVHPSLDVFATSVRRGRGVVATADIKEGEQLMLIPLCLCIHMPTKEEVEDHKAGHLHISEAALYLHSNHPNLSPFIATTLLLMCELAKGSKSEFEAYLAVMPTSHDCLLSWTSAERDLVKGTSLEGQEADVQGLFRKNVAPIMMQRPDLWPLATATFTNWQLVAGLVQSRGFHMEAHNWVTGSTSQGEELYLIPGIDMINHAVLAEERSTSLQMAPESLTVACGPDGQEVSFTGFFTMKAERGIREGEEVCHSYGEHSDAQLLQTFGFLEELPEGSANPNNCVHLPVSALLASCRRAREELLLEEVDEETRLQLLEQHCKVDRRGTFSVTTSDPLPDLLLTASQVLLSEDSDLEAMKADMEGPEAFSLGTEVLEGDPASAQLVGTALMMMAQAQLKLCESGSAGIMPDQISGPSPAPLPGPSGVPPVDPVRADMATRVKGAEMAVLKLLMKAAMQLSLLGGYDDDDDAEEVSEGEEARESQDSESQARGRVAVGEQDDSTRAKAVVYDDSQSDEEVSVVYSRKLPEALELPEDVAVPPLNAGPVPQTGQLQECTGAEVGPSETKRRRLESP